MTSLAQLCACAILLSLTFSILAASTWLAIIITRDIKQRLQ